jgi:hypothetical protein
VSSRTENSGDNFRAGYGSSRKVIPEKEEHESQGYESHWCDNTTTTYEKFFYIHFGGN